MEIIKIYNPQKDETNIKVKKLAVFFSFIKKWFIKFTNNFNKDKHELFKVNLVVFLFSLIISFMITFNSDDAFKVVSKVIGFLITYFSITIGFSLATLTFIIENLRIVKESNESYLLEKILSLIVIYILHGVFMIGIFILLLIFGNIITFTGYLYYITNMLLVTLNSMMIILNLYIFCKIVVILYYFALLILKK
ncbi:hypothetical protein BUZ56_11535 [Staphylococcus hyicus]|nr:hypothetical protein BUZ56_11535 [Staphylococcus hyicus]